jgi:2-polyprenyl-3-methyl-5-hydroxy-6-metoxy-1,4-benzoquinol methylase
MGAATTGADGRQDDNEGECPACASRQSRRWGDQAGEPIILCKRCGTAFYKRPIAQAHDYGTYHPYLEGFDDKEYRRQLGLRRARFRFQLEEIERLSPPGRRLIDFGAGPGFFCAVAQEMGWDVSGIDSSPVAVDAGSNNLRVPFISLDELADGSCSVITAFHVIEHLEDPMAVLKKLHRKLKPGGVLVVHVPNRESLSSLVRFWCRKAIKGSATRSGCLYYPEHLTGFTRSGLIMCASRAQFAIVRARNCSLYSRFYDSWVIPAYLAELKSDFVKGFSRLALRMLSGLVDLAGCPIGRGDWLVAHFRAQ